MKCNIPPPPLPEKHGGLAGEKDEKGSNACRPFLEVREIQGGMFELRSKLSIPNSLTLLTEMYRRDTGLTSHATRPSPP